MAELDDERSQIGHDLYNDLQSLRSTLRDYYADDSASGIKDYDRALVCECWCKDYSLETITETVVTESVDPETGLAVTQEVEQSYQRPKYPGNIRYIKTCNGGRLVLEDRGNPSINPALPEEKARQTYLWDKYPFTRVVSNTDPVSPWGACDIDQSKGLQAEFNKRLSQISKMCNDTARTQAINPLDSGVPNSHFTNERGVIRPTTSMQAQALRYLDSPKVDEDLYSCANLVKDLFFQILGSFELETAKLAGAGSIAYKAIALLHEEVHRLIREKAENYDFLIRERGRMYVSHVMNWYTEDRWFTYEVDGHKEVENIRGIDLILPVKMTVVRGSTMPSSKVQRREEMQALFSMGALGQPGSPTAVKALLKAMDVQGWAEIVQDIENGAYGPLWRTSQISVCRSRLLNTSITSASRTKKR